MQVHRRIGHTRLAPSPTGALHLGNARTFLFNWLIARQRGWDITLRIEDLDGPRVKPNCERATIELLEWLGIDWDSGPVKQSERLPAYKLAIDILLDSGQAYPCICTRKDIEVAASAPHSSDGAIKYPGTCDGRFADLAAAREVAGREPAIRFRVLNTAVNWNDLFAGPQTINPYESLGDFVIAKSDGTPAYQLAVSVDDLAMDIDHVIRGDDLLESTARQLLIMNAIAPERRPPDYLHLPLIAGPDGRRLAKRHGDSRLNYYREQGVAREKILQLLARWCGIDQLDQVTTPKEMLERFDLSKVDHRPIIFTASDELELLSSTHIPPCRP